MSTSFARFNVIFLVMLFAGVIGPNTASGQTVSRTISITNDADDGYEQYGSGWFSTQLNGGADLVGSWGGTAANWVIGYRFPSTGVGSGDTIQTSYLRLISSDGFATSVTCGSAPCPGSNSTFRVYGVAQDDGSAFSNTAGNTPLDVPLTTAYVDYTTTGPGDVHGSCQGQNNGQDTCTHYIDVTNIVQEITSRPGWTSNSAIRFVLKSTNPALNAYAGYEDYSANPAKAATLLINPPLPTVISSGGWGTSASATYPTTYQTGPFVYAGASTLLLFLGDYYNFYSQVIPQPTVSDNCGNTWNILAGPADWAGYNYFQRSTVYFVQNPISCSAGDTITVNVTPGEPIFLHFLALAGSNTGQAPNVSIISNPVPGGVTTTATSGPVSLSGPGTLLSWIFGDSDDPHTFTPQAGFSTDLNSIPNYLTEAVESVSLSGSYTNQFSISPSADGWQTVLLGFASSGGTIVTPSVTVTPNSSSITSTESLAVTVVVSGAPVPTGSVTLTSATYSSEAIGLTGGSATINVPAGSLSAGTDTLTANYTPDSSSSTLYTGATGTASVTVGANQTPTVTVTPSLPSIPAAKAFSVTVSVNGSTGSPTATGSVTLRSGSYTSAATALAGGTASFNIAAGSLSVGSDTLSATYTPDANSSNQFSGATGSASVTVTILTPSVRLSPSPSSITTAQGTAVSITVTSGTGTITPTGSVKLSSGSYTSAASSLSGGLTSITIPAGSLGAGTDTLTALYTPDSSSAPIYASATGSNSVSVTQASPVVTVTPGASSISTTQALSVKVTVAGTPTPTGSVALTGGSYTSATTNLSGGTATITIPAGTLGVGTYTFKANYTPGTGSSSIYGPATGTAGNSVSVSLTIPTVTVKPGSTSISTSQALSVTVTVAGTPTPTGSVTLSGGSYSSAAVTLNRGSATITIPAGTLTAGTYTFYATYTPGASSSSIYGAASGTASSTVTVDMVKRKR